MLPDIQDGLEEEAQAALDRAQAIFTAKNVTVKTVLRVGPVAANNIIDFAQEGPYGRIVLGSSNIHGFQRFLKGSTAARVAAYAPCEVVIVA